ncbi:SEC3 [Candida theae]|uniref:SEC3 n=1 Tax=Candida theae TaxID=1198502 RepID=A0AAD5BJS0_9ASCO|nr:SEC3 [Candida theae]KAI5968063.1 SEC3 [Candida theae]
MFRSPGKSKSKQHQAEGHHQYTSQRQQTQQGRIPPPPSSQHQQPYRTTQQNSFHPHGNSNYSPLPGDNGAPSPIKSSFGSIGREGFTGGSATPGSPSEISAHSNPEQQHKQTGDKITADCYSKSILSNGQKVHEVSYIAHISVQEFPHFSTHPPPPNVNPGPPKNRILVLCKKYSGRMLLQKGKFSEEGRFQVGRTWDLSELSFVKKAGSDGMILTITKDYYWRCDEDESRIWKFCRYLCQYYGIATGHYPRMDGFSVNEFMLPAVPKSPTQTASPTFQSIPRQEPTRTHLASPKPDSTHATKSLRQKIIHKPSIFSSDKSSHNGKQNVEHVSAPAAKANPTHKKTLSGGTYNGLDFTVNGQLPKKPMQVMQRDSSSMNKSQTSLDPSLKASSYQRETDPGQQNFNQMANRNDDKSIQNTTKDQSYYAPHADSMTTVDGRQNSGTENSHKSHPYAQKLVNEDSRSLMSSDSHSFVFGANDLKDSKQDQSTRGTDYSTSPYKTKTTPQQGAVKSMLEPLESVKERGDSKPELNYNNGQTLEEFPSVEQAREREGSSSSIPRSAKNSIGSERVNHQRDDLASASSQKRSSVTGSGGVYSHQRTRSQGGSSWSFNDRKRDTTDQSGVYKQSNNLPNDSMFIEESTQLEGSNNVGKHMKELEGMLDSHISGGVHDDSFDFNEVVNLNDEPEKPIATHAKAPQISNVDSTLDDDDDDDDDTHSILEETFEPGLNISKKTPTPTHEGLTTRSLLPDFERDVEAEELLRELNWSSSMDADTLVKSLNKELNKTKQETVKRLVDIDLSTTTANDIGAASSEVEHMLRIFQKMEINFKMLNADVNVIDENSKGLQLKFVNKKSLYDGLNGILSKVSVGAEDLRDIGEFKNFGTTSAIGALESKLLNLYNGLITIRSDSSHVNDGQDLSSLKALQQYKSKYESVSSRFVRHFYEFMKTRIDIIARELLSDVENEDPRSISQRLSQLLVYSGITYYLKEIGKDYFYEINNLFNVTFSKVLEKSLKGKLKKMKSDQRQRRSKLGSSQMEPSAISTGRRSQRFSSTPPLHNDSDIEDDMEDDEDFAPLRKGRSSRFARKGAGTSQSINKNRELDSEKQEQLESLKRHMIGKGGSSDELEDSKSVIGLIEGAKMIVMIFQYFIVSFFHYDAATLDFAEFLETKPFDTREQFADPAYFADLDFTDIGNNYSVSNDVIVNLDKVLGGFITTFIKIVNPIDINVPVILLHIEDIMKLVQESMINQDFLIYNFLQLVSEKYESQWRKFVNGQIDAIKSSTIVPNSGILSSVKQVNYILLITETSIGGRDIKGTKVRAIIDKTYVELTDALINLFSRKDPLVNSGGFDDKEREYKNVAILENIFYILQQLNDIGSANSSTKKLSEKLTQNFKRIEDIYFAKQVYKSIGKLVDFIEDCEKSSAIASSTHHHHQSNSATQSIKQQHHHHQQKKLAKSLLTQYSEDDIKVKVESIHDSLEKHFRKSYDQSGGRSGNDNLFTRDLIDKLWSDLETVFIDYFTRLGKILRSHFDREMDYHVGRQDIHHIFRSIRG